MLVKDLISKVANDVGDPFFILGQKASYVAELNELSKALWRDAGASIVFREYELPNDQSHYDLPDDDIIRFVNVAVSSDTTETARSTADIKDFGGDVLYYVNEKNYRVNSEQGQGVFPDRSEPPYKVHMTFWLNMDTGKYRVSYPSVFGTGKKLLVQAVVLGEEYTWDDEEHEIWDVVAPALTQGCIYRMSRNLLRYTKDRALSAIMQDAKEEWGRERRETIGLIHRFKEDASAMLVHPHFFLGGMDYSPTGEYYGSNIGT